MSGLSPRQLRAVEAFFSKMEQKVAAAERAQARSIKSVSQITNVNDMKPSAPFTNNKLAQLRGTNKVNEPSVATSTQSPNIELVSATNPASLGLATMAMPSSIPLIQVPRGPSRIGGMFNGLGGKVKKGLMVAGLATTLAGVGIGVEIGVNIGTSGLKIGLAEMTKNVGTTALSKSAKVGTKTFSSILEDSLEKSEGYKFMSELYTTGSQIVDRKILPMLGLEEKDKEVVSMLKGQGDRVVDTIVSRQDPKRPDNIYFSQIQELSNKKLGYRNRGDHTQIASKNGIQLTTYEAFARPQGEHYKTTGMGRSLIKIEDSQGVIGVDDKGNFVKGIFSDFKKRTDVMITPMPFNKIKSFEEDASGKQKFKVNKGGSTVPVVTVLDANGKPKSGSLAFATKGGRVDAYGSVEGGKVLFENPDTKQTYLVTGSIREVKEAFTKIKGKSTYVNSWLLDTGTYVKGLAKKDGILKSADLRNYDNLNRGGGSGLYIKDKP